MGLSATREDVVQEMHKSATDWLKQNDFEPPAEIISKPGGYNSLRTAIRQGHAAKALEIIQDLRKTHSDQQIEQAMHAQVTRPFTGSKEHEKAWVDGMSPKESLHYEQARELQRQEYEKFLELWDKRKRY